MHNASNPVPSDDPNYSHTESLTMHNKNEPNIDKNESCNSNRKYHFRNLFKNFLCCSCFRKDKNGHKYTAGIVNQKCKGLEDRNHNGCTDSTDNATISGGINNNPNNDNEQNGMKTNGNSNTNGKSATTNVISHNSPISNQNINDKIVMDNYNTDYQTDETLKHLKEICEEHKNKKCLVIDLDETLVHSSYGDVKSADIEVIVDIDGIQQKVNVCKRPHVDEFIEEMGKLYECVLFTASLGKYANPVMDSLDPSGKIFGNRRLFREACVYREGNYVKDLDSLNRETPHTLLLDNSPVSYLQHPRHAIQITSWFDDPEDTALLDLIPYLRDLAEKGNSVTVPEYLEQNPLPESVGIWGFPPTCLHWYLAQCHSVKIAKSMYLQQQQYDRNSQLVDEFQHDDEDSDANLEVSLEIQQDDEDEEEEEVEEVDEEEEEVEEGDAKRPVSETGNGDNKEEPNANLVIEIEQVENKDKSDKSDSSDTAKQSQSNADNATNKNHYTQSQLHKTTAGTARHQHHHYHHQQQQQPNNQLEISSAIKDFRRKSQAALEDAFHRPSVSSPVARPRSELHLGNDNSFHSDSDTEHSPGQTPGANYPTKN